jgi:hypothetical protein
MFALATVSCALLSALVAAQQRHVGVGGLILIVAVGGVALWWIGRVGIRQAELRYGSDSHRRKKT